MKGVNNLKGMRHLLRLNLSFTKMSNESDGIGDARQESSGNSLLSKSFRLKISRLTDAGLKDLQRLSHLKKFDLTFTNVTDSGLKYLEEIRVEVARSSKDEDLRRGIAPTNEPQGA